MQACFASRERRENLYLPSMRINFSGCTIVVVFRKGMWVDYQKKTLKLILRCTTHIVDKKMFLAPCPQNIA